MYDFGSGVVMQTDCLPRNARAPPTGKPAAAGDDGGDSDGGGASRSGGVRDLAHLLAKLFADFNAAIQQALGVFDWCHTC